MSDENDRPADGDRDDRPSRQEAFGRKVGAQEARKLRARKHGRDGIWLGFGAFGLIGWSVAVPTVLGAAVGVWLDKHHPGQLSWTLTLLGVGLAMGCLNAWHWVQREHRALGDEEEDRRD